MAEIVDFQIISSTNDTVTIVNYDDLPTLDDQSQNQYIDAQENLAELQSSVGIDIANLVFINFNRNESYVIDEMVISPSFDIVYVYQFIDGLWVSIQLDNNSDTFTLYDVDVAPTAFFVSDNIVLTITFNSTTGTFASDSTTTKLVQTNLDGTVSLSSIIEFPVKSGYVFRGWATTENGSVVYTPYATPTITEDTTLYAVWQKAESYLVREDSLVNIANAIRTKSNTSTTMTPDEMATAISGLSTKAILTLSTSHGTAPSNIGAKYTKPTNPTATGYTFVNWYKDSALTTLFDFDAVAEGANVYAKWSINDPTVSNPDITADKVSSYPLGTVTPAGSGQTVYYSEDNATWSTTCPEQSTKGTYTTYWKISAIDCDDRTGSFTTVIKYEGVEYYGTATALTSETHGLAATTIGNYALFGGGHGSSHSSTVDAYNGSLTRSTPIGLSTGRGSLAATTIGNYALFGGGSGYSTVDAYNSSLARSTPTGLSELREPAATTIGNYALFGGGYFNRKYYKTVDAYNSSLTRSTPTGLSVGRKPAATTIGNYALFGGGYDGSYSSTVDAYNSSLTRSTPTGLSKARSDLAATTIGNYYALFGGGSGSSNSSTVDAYNSSLTKSTPTGLSEARFGLAATTIGNYALFGGGSGSSNSSTVDAYNSSLTKSTPTGLSEARSGLAATTIGNYALFGGGSGNSWSSVVDVYTVEQ